VALKAPMGSDEQTPGSQHSALLPSDNANAFTWYPHECLGKGASRDFLGLDKGSHGEKSHMIDTPKLSPIVYISASGFLAACSSKSTSGMELLIPTLFWGLLSGLVSRC
jgi:hypothetical protein